MTNGTLRMFAVVGALLGAVPCWAAPVALSVGQTKTLSVGVPLSTVSVDDPAVVSTHKAHRGVELVGRATGKTLVHLRTVDGQSLDVTVSVVNEGTTLYEVSLAGN